MKSKLAFLFILLLGALLVMAVPFVMLAFGAVDLSASAEIGALESRLAPWGLENYLKRHAPEESNPFPGDAARATGLEHYKNNCLVCHGAPGIEGGEFALGLNPPAPDLTGAEIQGRTDGELFWVVKHGIRMTGMPAFEPSHDDEAIWKIVTCVRHLPELTEAEEARLSAGKEGGAHHHDSGSEEEAAHEGNHSNPTDE